MWWLAFSLQAFAQTSPSAPDVVEKFKTTRASISQDEKRQREGLNHLFLINKKIKETAKKQEALNQKVMANEANIRLVAQDVSQLESRTEHQTDTLNKRLRQLYQERNANQYRWLFSAQSPVELERNHRFLKRMIDSDHQQLKGYLSDLRELHKKRDQLRQMVVHFVDLQKQAQGQETSLASQLHEKSKFLEELRKSKEQKLSQLKDLRQENGQLGDVLTYAFFERRGLLRPPVEAPIKREFGTYVDPQFRFHLTHKGVFYGSPQTSPFHAVFHGLVVFANRLPGLGKAVIVDHGDNYYSVYAFAAQVKVKEGAVVQEGDVLGLSGAGSPLFGPGLYFEIRHFTDAIDPRPWIKDSVIKTAESTVGE